MPEDEEFERLNYRDDSCVVGVITHDIGQIEPDVLSNELSLPNPADILESPTIGQLLNGLQDNDARWYFVIDIKANISQNAYYDLRTNDLDVVTTLHKNDEYEVGHNMAMYDPEGNKVEVTSFPDNSIVKVDETDLRCFIIKKRALKDLDNLDENTTQEDICNQLRESEHIIYVDTTMISTEVEQ